eukprot:jgi/Botrbrau1/10589/Bobra.0358s0009.1
MHTSACARRWISYLSLLVATSSGVLGSAGFADVPIATVVPGAGGKVSSLYIRPLINTTENTRVKGYLGNPQSLSAFGDGWLATEGRAAQESVTDSPNESFLNLAGLIHIGSINTTSKLPLNGQLRGKGGVKAVVKAAPAPDLAPPEKMASQQYVNTSSLAGVEHRLVGLAAAQQQDGVWTGPKYRRRLMKLPNPQSTRFDTPDTGLCVGKGVIVQIVQEAIAVYSASTGRLLAGPTPLSSFFNVTDDGLFSFTYCIADSTNSLAFFVGALHTRNEDGGPQNRSLLVGPTNTTLYLATTYNPLGKWKGPFIMDITGLDPSNKPLSFPGLSPCTMQTYSCYTDFVSYGMNVDALWVSSNIIPVNSEGFIASDAAGTILMGINKKSLLNGNTTQPAHLVFSNFPGSLDFMALSIPQAVEPGFQEPSLGGVQFFAHAVQDENPINLFYWAVVKTYLISEGYPGGNIPQLVGPALFPLEHKLVPATRYFPQGLPTPGASSNHIRLQGARPTQLSLVGGLLYTAISTVVTNRGADSVGAMYVVAKPHVFLDELGVESVSQGLVGANNTWSILCPAVVANSEGEMVMAFSLAGLKENQDLTAGYVPIDPVHGPGQIRLTAGPAPVTIGGYARGLVPQGRYSTAVVDDKGSVWVVSQWQAGFIVWAPNWGTLLAQVNPAVYP